MKRLLIVVLAAAALWSAYWLVGAQSSRSAFTTWFEDRRAEGWVAEYDDFALRGFPNRFDATWEGLSLADPDSGLAFDLPIFQLLALSYRPTHVIAVGPHAIGIATPADKFTLASDQLRASLRLTPDAALELERAVLEGDNLLLSGAESAGLSHLNLAAERLGDATYRTGINAKGLTPPMALLQEVLGTDALPDRMESLTLDATVTFDRPWDITAIETARPQPQIIDLTTLDAQWGVMKIQAKGRIEADAQGRATGTVNLQATRWQDMLTIARQSGALTDTAARMAEGVLSMAAQASGNPDRLDAEITLRDGQAYLGFIPLGPVPPLRLR
ncbi:MAG: DUF2125 domain-containing protein [Pseudomonadota bacterium]|nr:DUF2125 domain-containing protein [Pseudomonadota bacterium]